MRGNHAIQSYSSNGLCIAIAAVYKKGYVYSVHKPLFTIHCFVASNGGDGNVPHPKVISEVESCDTDLVSESCVQFFFSLWFEMHKYTIF